MSFLTSMFKTEKPVIGMLHLRPLPGDPLYYPGGSVSQVVEAAKRDLEALQQGGVDGILIGSVRPNLTRSAVRRSGK